MAREGTFSSVCHWVFPCQCDGPKTLDIIAFFAPAGRRGVATGGAQPAASRAERNPWKACVLTPAPEGQRNPRSA